jgi:hypothetical protein
MKCGTKIDKGTHFCGKCGEKIEDISEEKSSEKEAIKQPTQISTPPASIDTKSYPKVKKPRKTKIILIGIIATVFVLLIVIFLLFGFEGIGNNGISEYKPGEIEYSIGDKWEYNSQYFYDEGEKDSMIYSNEVKDIISKYIDGKYYDVYEMKIYGEYISSEKIINIDETSLKLSKGFWLNTKYDNLKNEVIERSNNNYRKFDALNDQGQPSGLIYFENNTNNSITKKISGGLPDIVKIGTTWSTTYYINWTDSLLSQGSALEVEQFYPSIIKGEGTKKVYSECLSKKTIKTKAGKFETFKIRHETVGKEGYEISYYCPKIKNFVKYVMFDDNDKIIYEEELIKYSIKSEQSTNVDNSLIESKFYGYWDEQNEGQKLTWRFNANNTLDWIMEQYDDPFSYFKWKIHYGQLKIIFTYDNGSMYYDFEFSDNDNTLKLIVDEYGYDQIQTLIKQ